MVDFFSSGWFVYLVIPLLILIARIVDVGLGTVRIIFANKGIKFFSALIGFFEVLIWLLVITTIMKNLTNPVAYIAYALGFALGTYFGICIEEKISIGKVRIRIITKKNLVGMIDDLKPTKYVFVSDSVNSSQGKIKIINAFLERKYLKTVIKKVKERDADAFYTVEDLKIIKEYAKKKISFIKNVKTK
jgi:uncharacterized protein YebE (UPF0316 family)